MGCQAISATGISELVRSKEAVTRANEHMTKRRNEFENTVNVKLDKELKELERLRERKLFNLELKFENSKQPEHILNARRSRYEREIEKIFSQYLKWIEDTMTTEKHAWLQVLSVLKGD